VPLLRYTTSRSDRDPTVRSRIQHQNSVDAGGRSSEFVPDRICSPTLLSEPPRPSQKFETESNPVRCRHRSSVRVKKRNDFEKYSVDPWGINVEPSIFKGDTWDMYLLLAFFGLGSGNTMMSMVRTVFSHFLIHRDKTLPYLAFSSTKGLVAQTLLTALRLTLPLKAFLVSVSSSTAKQ
jgi:hypothetical protein